ncbi:hypothetical protein B0I35DRAFT_476348 [Stachybotrys elegans]|uniref:Uncharacterized protein n=1 Tax=Stachybotrys elegans TaxID=80388 RepID=A0A8K0WT29_9HYPO|nr:hypothetical protein B0I35DRAFT_476348 [Stachybotrys elegans]
MTAGIRREFGHKVVFSGAPRTLYGGFCMAHEGFFQSILNAHGPHRVTFAPNALSKEFQGLESVLEIPKGQQNHLFLRSSHDFALNHGLFIASAGGRIPVMETETRLLDPDTVRWECPSWCLYEELRELRTMPTAETYDDDATDIRKANHWITSKFPDLVAFNIISKVFIDREFSVADDALSALSGLSRQWLQAS